MTDREAPVGAEDGAAPAGDPQQSPSASSPSGDQDPTSPVVRASWYRDRLLIGAVLAVLAVDQLTKYIVKSRLDIYESWPQEGLFRISYGTNSGAAFGLLNNQTVYLAVASLFAIGFLYYFYRVHAMPHRLLRLAIGLQLGGAVGNLTDRLRLGAVVDFIDVGWWPVFNLADSSIVVGVAMLLAVVFVTNEGQPRGGRPG